MNILFYSPVNFRCRDLESLAIKFYSEGNNVFFLTQCGAGEMHDSLRSFGIEAFSSTRKNLTAKIYDLISFCRYKKVDIVFSHLEPTNFISVVAQFFMHARVVIFRHHVDEAKLYGFERSLTYRLTYVLAKKIVVVSEAGRHYMIHSEGVPPRKIHQINLGYNFNLYDIPVAKAKKPQEEIGNKIDLITVGRLTKYKRQDAAIRLISKLRKIGIDAHLRIVGIGPLEGELKSLVSELNLQNSVSFVGFVSNVLSHLATADLLIHPSVSESSCVVVKEAALVGLPVVVCKGVGDFEEYIVHHVSGVLINQEVFIDEAVSYVQDFLGNREHYRMMGSNLSKEVISRFSIDKTFPKFLQLIGPDRG